ncbi:MAG: Holliday junction branch migration protein RuvA [Clostridia bacterium]|jgi:Holliday junction DNA helicase RuvA|nr:Holliday junction branch migration protein RuvA [Clostridia bacterium]
MFAYIKGTLEMKLNDSVIVETNGVGYKIFMAQNAIEKAGNIGEIVKIHTHYHVREDNISLYGFLSSEELMMFELLISVSGIGAKSALTILANIEPHNFALAIITNDEARLTKIPGLGKKTVARLIIELRDKMKKIDIDEVVGEENAPVFEANDNIQEAISALQVLGYNKKEIEKALGKENIASLSVEDIIRKGLTILSRD